MKSAGGSEDFHKAQEMVSPPAKPSARTCDERNRERIDLISSRRRQIYTEESKALDFWVDSFVTYLANWAFASDKNPVIRRIIYEVHDRMEADQLFVPGKKFMKSPSDWAEVTCGYFNLLDCGSKGVDGDDVMINRAKDTFQE